MHAGWLTPNLGFPMLVAIIVPVPVMVLLLGQQQTRTQITTQKSLMNLPTEANAHATTNYSSTHVLC
jgi:hypothetical protein